MRFSSPMTVVDFLRTWSFVLSPCAAMWTIALSMLSFRRPHAPLRRLTCHPGVVASWSFSIMLSTLVVLQVINMMWGYGYDISIAFRPYNIMFELVQPAGCAVLTTWIIAALGNRWRPEADWVDRSGRILGMIWIASLPLSIIGTRYP